MYLFEIFHNIMLEENFLKLLVKSANKIIILKEHLSKNTN